MKLELLADHFNNNTHLWLSFPTTSPEATPAAPVRVLFPCATASTAFTTAWATTRPAPSGGLFDNFSNIRRSTICQGCTQITASQSLYHCRCSLYRLLVLPPIPKPEPPYCCYTLAAPHPAL
nr:hypothetical protein [Escherichia coli]